MRANASLPSTLKYQFFRLPCCAGTTAFSIAQVRFIRGAFREANVKLLDEGYDLQRSHDAADAWSERLDCEELEASLREVAEEEERTGFETRYFAVEAPPPELRVVE